jgi:hypothetical protein
MNKLKVRLQLEEIENIIVNDSSKNDYLLYLKTIAYIYRRYKMFQLYIPENPENYIVIKDKIDEYRLLSYLRLMKGLCKRSFLISLNEYKLQDILYLFFLVSVTIVCILIFVGAILIF